MESVVTGSRQQDQLGFFLFLAFTVHIMLVLGISFTVSPPPAVAPQLEVTLARSTAAEAPEDARFVAQNNQEGSGDLADHAEITTRHRAEFSNNRVATPGASAPQLSSRSKNTVATLTTTGDAVDTRAESRDEPAPPPLPTAGLDPRLRALNDTIASLEARLDQQQQAYAERPRVRRLTSLSARAAVDAAYLHAWRTRVEDIGNRYYPVASSRYGIYGDLRLLVAVRKDGSIDTLEILSSSGHAVLDEAAMRIVRMAAPFEPFPPELSATTDLLEIIRTWKFRENRLRSVEG